MPGRKNSNAYDKDSDNYKRVSALRDYMGCTNDAIFRVLLSEATGLRISSDHIMQLAVLGRTYTGRGCNRKKQTLDDIEKRIYGKAGMRPRPITVIELPSIDEIRAAVEREIAKHSGNDVQCAEFKKPSEGDATWFLSRTDNTTAGKRKFNLVNHLLLDMCDDGRLEWAKRYKSANVYVKYARNVSAAEIATSNAANTSQKHLPIGEE